MQLAVFDARTTLKYSNALAAEPLPESLERIAGGGRGNLGVDLHRDRDLVVPKDLHRHARMHVESGQQDAHVLRVPWTVILGTWALVMHRSTRLIHGRPMRHGPSSSAPIVQLAGTASRPPTGRRCAMASPAQTRPPTRKDPAPMGKTGAKAVSATGDCIGLDWLGALAGLISRLAGRVVLVMLHPWRRCRLMWLRMRARRRRIFFRVPGLPAGKCLPGADSIGDRKTLIAVTRR